MTPELKHKLLKLIQENPNLSQRDLAEELGISLGRINYCLKALIQKGYVKAKNFKNSKNKLAYAYLLTPTGFQEKAKLTLEFFEIKKREYEELKKEVEGVNQGRLPDFSKISPGQSDPSEIPS
jgi:EPS-associated MarR family transcriptional regulator